MKGLQDYKIISYPALVAGLVWRHRLKIAILLWTGLLAWTYFAPADIFISAIGYFIFAVLFLAVLPWPFLFASLFLLTGVALNYLLNWISLVKAELTDMPLLLPDLHIALRDPMGLVNAVRFSPVWFFAATFLTIAVFLGAIFFLARHYVRKNGWPGLRETAVFTSSIFALAICLSSFSGRLFDIVKPPSKIIAGAWVPEGLAKASAQLGALPFFLFTQRLEAAGSGNYFNNVQPAANQRLLSANAAEVLPVSIQKSGALKPNIVFVLLESTFDVNATFDIVPPVKTTFSGNYNKAIASGALHVNAIGGGTWITEFETITGVDSRLFGLAGLYTHVSLSPKFKESFVTYLHTRGYDSRALYPVEGDFYSARFGYKNYGFEHFVDGKTLNLKNGWFSTDMEVMDAYLPQIKPRQDRPFFVYAVMMENHSPHPCVHFKSGQFPHRFAKESDKDMNCQLNEYILRQKTTEKAIEKLENHLRDIEAKTGRPYVIAMFGDHLPNTFAGANGEVFMGSRAYRHLLRQPRDRTFYQIRGSVKGAFQKKRTDISTYFLPSLVSSFVATSANDLYLGVNYLINKKCGAKLPFSVLTFHYLGSEKGNTRSTPECKSMLNAAIPVYRKTLLKR